MAAPFDPDTTFKNTNVINESERSLDPADDVGKLVQLEADGRLTALFTRNGETTSSGETINGAITPVPVYQNKVDNNFYACDANDNTKYKFLGFAVSDGTVGNPISVQFSGIVAGFTGLSEGEKYYVQDAVGTIGTGTGTQEILVGIAISPTQLLIQKGRRFATGVLTTGVTGTTPITVGFRPSIVRIHATESWLSASASVSFGSWTPSGNKCSYVTGLGNDAGSGTDSFVSWRTNQNSGTVLNVTDTGFGLSNNHGSQGALVRIYWEAEGEL